MEMDLTKIAKAEWEPLGPQKITAFRLYLAPDGHTSGVYEDVEITDEMVERARCAYVDACNDDRPQVDSLGACIRAALAVAFAESGPS